MFRYFHHNLIRAYTNQFANLFNNITILKVNFTNDAEIKRIKVPLTFGPKERYDIRPEQDPDLKRPINTIFPRMSFEMTGISYAPERQQVRTLVNAKANTQSALATTYIGTPYNMTFTLTILSRNFSESNQIVEQILPYFAPDYNVQVNLIPQIGIIKDIPIIMNSVSQDIEYEGGDDANTRQITTTMMFTMQAWYYGPVQSSGLIRKVIANIYDDPTLLPGYILTANMNNGNNGTYSLDDFVYQGTEINTSTAIGKVLRWNANTAQLVIGGAQGTFKSNTAVRAESSNANYTIVSFDTTPIKLVTIEVTPDPLTANANDDYGYTTTIREWPDA